MSHDCANGCRLQNAKRQRLFWATKLLVFATGREMGFSDRPVIDEIMREAGAKGHGVRDLLHAVIRSDLFLTK